MSLKRFFAYSFAVHFLIIVAVTLLTPAIKEKKRGEEFLTTLVSPDEVPTRLPFIPAKPRSHYVPHTRQKTSVPAPPPAIKDNREVTPEKGISSFAAPVEGGSSASGLPSPFTHPIPVPETEGGRQSKGGSQKPGKPGIPAREKLFDKNIIGDLAKRETEKKEKERKESTLTFDTSEYRFLTYNERLKERIENIWIYPSEEAARGIYGELIIRFTIKKNGRLGAVELVRTSGYKSLDDAAIKALRDGEPYWPLPNDWGMDAYTIEGHFIYTIYGYYVR